MSCAHLPFLRLPSVVRGIALSSCIRYDFHKLTPFAQVPVLYNHFNAADLVGIFEIENLILFL